MEGSDGGSCKTPKCRNAISRSARQLILLLAKVLPQVPKAPSDTLHKLERTATAVVSAIMAHQSATQGLSLGGLTTLNVSSGLNVSMSLPARTLTLSEVQRYKRSFVTVHKKAMTIGTVEKGVVDLTEDAVARKLVEYLEENLKP